VDLVADASISSAIIIVNVMMALSVITVSGKLQQLRQFPAVLRVSQSLSSHLLHVECWILSVRPQSVVTQNHGILDNTCMLLLIVGKG